MKTSLSGIKPTNTPHLGNYFGMIRPAIELQQSHQTLYFVANYHALTTAKDPEKLRNDTYELTAAFLASGYNPENGAFFRQSDIPEIPEIMWYLSCSISLGDLFRAHTFKAAKDKGEEGEMNMGTFAYPVLMAADILAYDSDVVPVGKDQIQHVEITRAIAKRFNHYYGEVFKEPQELIRPEVATVPGIDGRKMSKSYGNGIDPFRSAKEVKKQVMAIVTDSKGLEDKKDPDTCNIFALFKLFSSADEQKLMAEKYRAGGYGYGHAKLALLEKIEAHFSDKRKMFDELIKDRGYLDEVLKKGALKARAIAAQVNDRARKACGIT